MFNGLCIECFSILCLRLYNDSCKAPVRAELTTPGLLDQGSNRWAMGTFLPCFSMVAAKFLHKHPICKARRPEHSSCYLKCVISVIKSLYFVNRYIVNTLGCLVSIFRAKNIIDSLATSVLVYVQCIECFSILCLRLYKDSCKAPVRVELTTPGLQDQCSNRWAMEPYRSDFPWYQQNFYTKTQFAKPEDLSIHRVISSAWLV